MLAEIRWNVFSFRFVLIPPSLSLLISAPPFYKSAVLLFTATNTRDRISLVAVYVVQLLCDRSYTKSGRSKTGRTKTRRTTTMRTQPCRRAAERTNTWRNNDCFIWHCPCSLLPFSIVCQTKTCDPPLVEWRGFIVIHIVLQRVHGGIFNGFPWGLIIPCSGHLWPSHGG
jgi:hypothetical protein